MCERTPSNNSGIWKPVDVAGLESAASSLRMRFLAFKTGRLSRKSFSHLAHVGTPEHLLAPPGKKNRTNTGQRFIGPRWEVLCNDLCNAARLISFVNLELEVERRNV
jgi:hypothetical protein